MAMSAKQKAASTQEEMIGFDVIVEQVVGHVELDDTPIGQTAVEAAFGLIARHGTSGTFRFPNEKGGMIVVEVEYPLGPTTHEPFGQYAE